MRVSVDADLCSGCGCCVSICPAVFTHVGPDGVDSGTSHVRDGGKILAAGEIAPVAGEYEEAVMVAARECPGEIITVLLDGLERGGQRWL